MQVSRWSRHVAFSIALCTIVMSYSKGVAESIDFERDVAPILAARCLECHNGRDLRGGLDLTTAEGLIKGGDSGPAVDRQSTATNRAESSHLMQRVKAGEMPPEQRGVARRLAETELQTLQHWIEQGATWPDGRVLGLYERTTTERGGEDWWAWQPVVRPELPPVAAAPRNSTSADQHPIDRFIAKSLHAHGWQPAPPASPAVLVRRAYIDLWGLPPTPAQIDAFLSDERPNAWEQLIDTLLSSPHYGERWARHWLDVVRFAETCGYERDQLKPQIWRYRDWVIDAFNRDMPYDQFVTHQLAGDEIPDRNEASVIATGMIRAGTWNDEPNDPADYLYERLEDIVHTTGTAFLGLTIKCARCHDHKFDPIPQTDYYRLASFFWAGYIGQENLGGPTSEQLGFDVFGWTDRSATADPIRWLRNGERGHPGDIVEPGFLTAIPQLDQPLHAPPADSRTTHRRLQFAQWITDPRNPLTARVLVNRLWLHHFGEAIVRSPDNFGFKGELPTHPELLDWLAAELVHPTVLPTGSVADEAQQSNLERPWSLKRLHKLIMMSQTYQQASLHPQHEEYAAVDALNRLWWKANRRRLDAETLRDAMLLASGDLNEAMGGPSFVPRVSAEALEGLSQKEKAWEESDAVQRQRRSIYMITKRSRVLPLMTTFDFCDTTRPCGQRDVTTVPTQALALLNNEFVHEQSDHLAQRVEKEAGSNRTLQLQLAWRYSLGRLPNSTELEHSLEHIEQQLAHFLDNIPAETDQAAKSAKAEHLALASLCHVLLNTNEFIYVD